jgi:hypothetical protein
VTGDANIGALGGAVDTALTEQVDRFASFVATGKPAR